MEVKSYQVTVNLKKARTAPHTLHKSIFGNSNTRQKLLLEHGNHCSVLTPTEHLWYKQHLSLPDGSARCKVRPPSLVARQPSGEHQTESNAESISLWKYQPWQSSTQRTYALRPGPRCHQLVSLTNTVDTMIVDSTRVPPLPGDAALLPFLESTEEEPVVDPKKGTKSKKKREKNKPKTSKSHKLSSDDACQSPQKGRQKSIVEHFTQVRSAANDIAVIFDSRSQESRCPPTRASIPEFVASTSMADAPPRVDTCSVSSSEDDSEPGIWSDRSLSSPTPFDDSVDRELFLADALVSLQTRYKNNVRRKKELEAFINRENDVRWLEDFVLTNKGKNYVSENVHEVRNFENLQLHSTPDAQVSLQSPEAVIHDKEKIIGEPGSKSCEESCGVLKNNISERTLAPVRAASTPIGKHVTQSEMRLSCLSRQGEILDAPPDIPMNCPLSSIKKSPLFRNRYKNTGVEDSTSPVISTSKSRKLGARRTSAKRLFCNDLSTIQSDDEEIATHKSPSPSPLSFAQLHRDDLSLKPEKSKSIFPPREQESGVSFKNDLKMKLSRFSVTSIKESFSSTSNANRLISKPIDFEDSEQVGSKISQEYPVPYAKADVAGSCSDKFVSGARFQENNQLLLPTNFIKHSTMTSASSGGYKAHRAQVEHSVEQKICSPESASDATVPLSLNAPQSINAHVSKESTVPASDIKPQRNLPNFLHKSIASKITFDLEIDDLIGNFTPLVSLDDKSANFCGTKASDAAASNFSTKNNDLSKLPLFKKYPEFFEDDFDASCDLSLFTTERNESESMKVKDSESRKSGAPLCSTNVPITCDERSLNQSSEQFASNESVVPADNKSDNLTCTLLSVTQAIVFINDKGGSSSKKKQSPLEQSVNVKEENLDKKCFRPDAIDIKHAKVNDQNNKTDRQSGQPASVSEAKPSPSKNEVASLREKAAEDAKKAIDDLASLIGARGEDPLKVLSNSYVNDQKNINKSFDLFDDDCDSSLCRDEEVRFAPETVLSSQRRRQVSKLSKKVKNKSFVDTEADSEIPEWQAQDCDLLATTSSDLSSSNNAGISLLLPEENLIIDEPINVSQNLIEGNQLPSTTVRSEMHDTVCLLDSSSANCSLTNENKGKKIEKALGGTDQNANAVMSQPAGLAKDASIIHLSSENPCISLNLKENKSRAIPKHVNELSAVDLNESQVKKSSPSVGSTLLSNVSSAVAKTTEVFSKTQGTDTSLLLVQPRDKDGGCNVQKAKRKLSLKNRISSAANVSPVVSEANLSSFKLNDTVDADTMQRKHNPCNNTNSSDFVKNKLIEAKKVKFDVTNEYSSHKSNASSSSVNRTLKSIYLSCRESVGRNPCDESAMENDVSVLQPNRGRSRHTGRVINSDTSGENESFEGDRTGVKSKSLGRSTFDISISEGLGLRKPEDVSTDSCSSEDFDFCARGPPVDQPHIPVAARKKPKRTGGRCQFVNMEADVSYDSRVVVSSDEDEEHHDNVTKYDESFVDDRHQPSQEATVDMRSVYLRSVRSPALRGKDLPKTRNWRPRIDVCSQPYEYDEDESYAESDNSFVVSNDCVEYESELPLGNDAEDSLMVARGASAAPPPGGKKRKRIVLADSSSDEDG